MQCIPGWTLSICNLFLSTYVCIHLGGWGRCQQRVVLEAMDNNETPSQICSLCFGYLPFGCGVGVHCRERGVWKGDEVTHPPPVHHSKYLIPPLVYLGLGSPEPALHAITRVAKEATLWETLEKPSPCKEAQEVLGSALAGLLRPRFPGSESLARLCR